MLRTCLITLLLMGHLLGSTQTLDDAVTFIHSGQLDSAQNALDEAPRSARQLALKAYVHSHQGHPQKAILYYQETLHASPSPKLRFDCHKNLALKYQNIGLIEYAIDEYKYADQSLSHEDLKTDINLQQKEAFSLNLNKGLLAEIALDYSNALIFFERALDNAQNQDDRNRVLNMVGVVYKNDSRFEEAIQVFDSVINSPSQNAVHLGRAHHDKAMTLLEQGKDPLPDLKKALEYKVGSARFVTLMDLGEITQDLAMLESALEYLPAGTYGPDYYKIFGIIADLYVAEGNIERSQHYNIRYREASTAYVIMVEEAERLALQHSTINMLAQYAQNQELAKDKWWLSFHLLWIVPTALILAFFTFRIVRWRNSLASQVAQIQNTVRQEASEEMARVKARYEQDLRDFESRM